MSSLVDHLMKYPNLTTWHTSDTHFFHTRILELCNRPFTSVTHMNEAIIERYNSVVAPEDVVYHHGDVALGSIDKSLPLVGHLNGYKILIPGNHDRVWHDNKPAYRERFMIEYLKYFQEVWDEDCYSHEGLRMTHLPFHGDSHHDDRYADSRPIPAYPGQWLICGHVHEKWKIKDHQINVGVDQWNFTPVSSNQIRSIMESE